jgi:hypothetical protein
MDAALARRRRQPDATAELDAAALRRRVRSLGRRVRLCAAPDSERGEDLAAEVKQVTRSGPLAEQVRQLEQLLDEQPEHHSGRVAAGDRRTGA